MKPSAIQCTQHSTAQQYVQQCGWLYWIVDDCSRDAQQAAPLSHWNSQHGPVFLRSHFSDRARAGTGRLETNYFLKHHWQCLDLICSWNSNIARIRRQRNKNIRFYYCNSQIHCRNAMQFKIYVFELISCQSKKDLCFIPISFKNFKYIICLFPLLKTKQIGFHISHIQDISYIQFSLVSPHLSQAHCQENALKGINRKCPAPSSRVHYFNKYKKTSTNLFSYL